MPSDLQLFARMCRARKNAAAELTEKECQTGSWAALERAGKPPACPKSNKRRRGEMRLPLGTGKRSSDEVTSESGRLGVRGQGTAQPRAAGAAAVLTSISCRASPPETPQSPRKLRGSRDRAAGRPEGPPGAELRPRGSSEPHTSRSEPRPGGSPGWVSPASEPRCCRRSHPPRQSATTSCSSSSLDHWVPLRQTLACAPCFGVT